MIVRPPVSSEAMPVITEAAAIEAMIGLQRSTPIAIPCAAPSMTPVAIAAIAAGIMPKPRADTNTIAANAAVAPVDSRNSCPHRVTAARPMAAMPMAAVE